MLLKQAPPDLLNIQQASPHKPGHMAHIYIHRTEVIPMWNALTFTLRTATDELTTKSHDKQTAISTNHLTFKLI